MTYGISPVIFENWILIEIKSGFYRTQIRTKTGGNRNEPPEIIVLDYVGVNKP